ncbi:MAG: histidine kinase [Planctomycetes bacterium RBG_16_64_12]|nr:MAG: histidine kinase [Planctomycetes bacterium RBG_16_64_12]
MPSLFVIRGNDQGTRFELAGEIVGVGRDSSNLVQLHDTEASRQHAEIRHAEGSYVIADLNSSNGTFVNGRKVEEHRLASGDQVQIGGTLMLFTRPAEETGEDLTDQISIASDRQTGDESHIIHSLSHAEGSRIFRPEADIPQNSWLARARSNLQVMYRTALAVSHTLDIEQLLHRIMDLIFEWVEADRGCIMLAGAAGESLEPKVRRTRKGVRTGQKITISKTILDYVIQRNEGVLTSDAREDNRWQSGASILQMGIREAICVPMQGRYDMVGVIYIDTSTSPQEVIQKGGATKFTQDHLKLMIAIAHQAALAVEDTRYYSAMVQAERLAAVGQTIATLSHHIKNILQGIRGGSYLIEMGLTEHDESVVSKGWKIVEKNQNKISALVMDMLTFSKEREPELAPANLNQVVSDVVELIESHAADMEVELRWEPAEEMPELVFDPEGIHRAVLNVVTNGIDAACECEKAGRVDVATRYAPDEGKALVVVSDNGPGIPPERLDSLFSPFVSFKSGRGTGLGLPVSQKILTEHGGRILVESTPGEGSRFTLELPAVMPDSARQTIVR